MQHQRARSLSGELKRILIPQGATSVSTPSMSQQETYNYTPSVRASSSQSHQIHQQQQIQQQPPLQHQLRHQQHQQYQQHQQHQQHQQQLLSPVEPPGLEENLNNVAIERYLEVGNYEDAFVAVRII